MLPSLVRRMNVAEPHPSRSGQHVDGAAGFPIHCEPPVADWIEFLAELIARDLLRNDPDATA